MTNKSQGLKNMLCSGQTVVMPDAYDPLSAMLIEQAGFPAVQCSGFSMAIAAGVIDEDHFGLEANLAVTAAIVNKVGIPVMADGEDGFADIARTITAYIQTGVAGINIEDKIPHLRSVQVIDAGCASEKIKLARAAAVTAGNPDLVINARTDALTAMGSRAAGLRESIMRGNLFLENGADLVFVTKVETLEEVETLVKEIDGPISITAGTTYNINNFSIKQLRDCGVARVSLPTIAIQTVIAGLKRSLNSLADGEFTELLKPGRLCDKAEIAALLEKNYRNKRQC